MRYEKKYIFIAVITVALFLVGGCKESTNTADTTFSKEDNLKVISEEPVTTQEAQTKEMQQDEVMPKVLTEVNSLYQSQTLMLELLVNESCGIQDSGDLISITTPDNLAYIGVSFVPGIQNLTAAASLLPSLLEENYKATTQEVSDGYLFGARAKLCEYSIVKEDGSNVQGIFTAAIVNQSLYLMDVAMSSECTEEDGKLILNVFSSMNVLTPTTVNQETKTASYESKYTDVTPSKESQATYVPVKEWVYLPYYYYGWDSGYDYTSYDSSFYEPDWDYYSNGNWWSWNWDDNNDWNFYDQYSDWYAEDYYDGYSDYYSDYDPYSDSGDYYDYYDYYSDPGDMYDDVEYYSDPGDTYDDVEYYSDPGDTYDDVEYYSDPGDTYDDIEYYSDPGDTYDNY